MAQNSKQTIKGIETPKNQRLKNIILAITSTDIISQTIARENTGSEFFSKSL
jgi:hypothetical protein